MERSTVQSCLAAPFFQRFACTNNDIRDARWRAIIQNDLLSIMTEPTKEQVEQLTRAFERFTRRFKVAEAAAAGDNELNALDSQALLFVGDHPGCGIGDVARYLKVALTTMSSAIDRLVRKDLVARGRPEGERRSAALDRE